MSFERCSDAKCKSSSSFESTKLGKISEQNKERRDTCISTTSNPRVKDIQIDDVIQAHPDERTHLTNTEATSSNINEMSHAMTKENRPPDKERDKPPPPPQNPINPQKSKTSVFIVGDCVIKKVDEYLLTSSLKHQYLVKTRPFSTAKTIDMYDYIKPAKRDFKPEICVLHVGANDLSLSKSPKEISEDIVTLTESMKTENNKIIVSSIVCRDEVNAHLEEICAEKDIEKITHSNINPKRHLNKSRLYLNDAGISVLVRNFKAFLTNLD